MKQILFVKKYNLFASLMKNIREKILMADGCYAYAQKQEDGWISQRLSDSDI